MKNLDNYFLPIIGLILCLVSCKTDQIAIDNIKKEIPDRYHEQKDTFSTASLRWAEFFNDSNLIALIQEGLNNNFDLKNALQRIEMSRANVRAAKGLVLPEVSASASVAQRRFGLYTMDGAGNATTNIYEEEPVPVHLKDYFLGLQTSWEIDVWGKLKSRKAGTMARFLASVEGRNAVVTSLVYDIAGNFYNLLALDLQLDVVTETLKLQENALDLTMVQKEAGVVNQLAVEQFEAQILNTRSLEKEIIQEIVITENLINFLLGRYPQKIKRDKSKFLEDVSGHISAGIPSDLLRYRPDIRQSEIDLIAANADIRSAKAAFLPSIRISGLYGFQAYKTSFLFETPESIAYSIIGGLTAPLINRSAIKAEFEVSKANQLEALYNYQKAILTGYVEVYNELSSLRNLNEILILKEKQVEVLANSIETSKELYQYRRATYLEVIMSQRNALESKLELVEIKKRQFVSIANLYKALGGGWN